MCGIVGILGQEDRATAQRMLARIAHRGPDGHGTWTDAQVTLGHARLAILDVAHGQQPMADSTGRYTIVYNGECYNHNELRPALEAAGVRFRTTTDTETVLEGYGVWGADVLSRMEGMFAFAIWDVHDRRLFIARDPWGVKPFFYARSDDGAWLFASEQKALFAHPGVSARADVDRIKERAALEFLTGQATLFAGVHQLLPGTYARLGAGDESVHWHPYYQVPTEAFSGPEEAAHAIRDRFVQSVREQLLSDVPVGVVLSGGLDSAAVATVQQSLCDEPVHTFTVAESEDVADFQAARSLAVHLGTDHHETFFDADDVLRGLPAWTWHNENINFTEFFFRPLFRLMAEHVKVGLCGQGSDELWGGYDRYREPLALARTRLDRLHRCRPRHVDDLSAQVAVTHQSGSSLAEWDQQGQLANFQLRLVDRNAMAHGLEVRVPFLSRPLHAASRAVGWDWKLHGPVGQQVEKWVLRKGLEALGTGPGALRHTLPKELIGRRKVPAGRATGPRVMAAFEREAARMVDPAAMGRHPLACAFSTPAEFLVFRLWEETFLERQGEPGPIDLETLAS